ncbi:unnamed protein product [Symbiodinium natans]|uniref:Uncharacterized protein n=1 Tax=Symbiodinium natans TaxID=878477 RepID=A0A812GEW4_9DINO|nr:unnamed protein product [Symbiodinium natans]
MAPAHFRIPQPRPSKVYPAYAQPQLMLQPAATRLKIPERFKTLSDTSDFPFSQNGQWCRSLSCGDDVTLARDFNLVIKTKDENNCGTGRDVHATLDGVTADGSEVSNSQQRMATKKYDDFKRGDRQTYAYRSSERMRPSQICLKLDIGGASPRWCVEYVRVLNGDVSGSPQIGEDVTGWVDFDQVNDKQCLNLQFQ